MEQLSAQGHSVDMKITVTHHGSLLAGESECCQQHKGAVTANFYKRNRDIPIGNHTIA